MTGEARNPRRPARATAVVCVASLLLGTGCARIVTLDPETVARRNDAAWKVRATPAAAPLAPIAAPAAPFDAPPPTAAPVAPPTVAPVAPPTVAPVAPPTVAPVAPLPFRMRPEVREALLSPPDALGIPAALYAVDPLLLDYRREMDSQASARHAVGAGTIVFGVIFAGLSGLAIGLGANSVNSPDPKVSSSATQTLVYGTIFGVFSVAELIAGIVMAASPSDPAPLQSYYRETYSEPP